MKKELDEASVNALKSEVVESEIIARLNHEQVLYDIQEKKMVNFEMIFPFCRRE